jgi:peptidyl-prolyl cis-trans isomerase C
VLQPSNRWQGPIKSDYGYHLVLLTQREPARLPDFAQIREEVRQDLLRDVVAAYRETAIKDLTRRYTVRREVN